MSDQACFKEIICATAEAAYAISAYAEFATPDELDQCRRDTMRYQKMRNVLAERKDAADAERVKPV